MKKAAAIYDLAQYPVTFDTCNFFAIFATLCEQSGIDSVSLFIVCERFRSAPIESEYPADYQYQKMLDCVVSLGHLSKYIDNIHIVSSVKNLRHEGYDFLFDGVSPGRALPRLYDFKTIEELLGDESPEFLNRLFTPYCSDQKKSELYEDKVIFFKRNSVFNKPRNTPTDLFELAAEKLNSCDIPAVVIEDKEHTPIEPLKQIPMFTISERLAAAEQSRLSITWGGGIGAPLWFSEAPLLICGMMNEAVPIDSAEMSARKGPFRYIQPIWFGEKKQFWWIENQLITPESLSSRVMEVLKKNEDAS
ncbi:hypothetical protein OAT10_02485 [Luminiphilus sp.]|nr:hypothetical protein [Luminiphilus sp.]